MINTRQSIMFLDITHVLIINCTSISSALQLERVLTYSADNSRRRKEVNENTLLPVTNKRMTFKSIVLLMQQRYVKKKSVTSKRAPPERKMEMKIYSRDLQFRSKVDRICLHCAISITSVDKVSRGRRKRYKFYGPRFLRSDNTHAHRLIIKRERVP